MPAAALPPRSLATLGMTSVILVLAWAFPACAADVCSQISPSYAADEQWRVGGDRLVLCSYGEKAKRVGKGTWERSEFAIVLEHGGTTRSLLDFDAEMTARYTAVPPVFTFTELTVRADGHRWTNVPLVRHTLRLGVPHPKMTSSFVLRASKFDRAEFERMLHRLGGLPMEEYERTLYRVRDMAVGRPSLALRYLHEAQHAPWADAHYGEELSSVIREVELARDLPHAK